MSDQSRRKLLKSIAAGSGAIVAGKSLPESWSKPVVDYVILPVHAQTSQIPLNFSTNQFLLSSDTPGLREFLVPSAHAGFSIETATLAVFFEADMTNYSVWFEQNYFSVHDVYVGSGTGTGEAELPPQCSEVGSVRLTLNSGPNLAGIGFTMTRDGEGDIFTGTLLPDDNISTVAPPCEM